MGRGYFGLPRNTLVQFNDAFLRLDVTSEDLCLILNGRYIVRVPGNEINSLLGKLSDSEISEKLAQAKSDYSDTKVSHLLDYSPGIDYKLLGPLRIEYREGPLTGYYLFSKVMSLDKEGVFDQFGEPSDHLDDRGFSQLKYKLARDLCNNLDVKYPNEVENGSRTGVNYKSILRQTQEITQPLRECLERRNLEATTKDLITDYIARRYDPEQVESIKKSVQKIASVFSEMYSESKRYGVLMPSNQQLLTFFGQVSRRIFGEMHEPINIFIVTCPVYNDQDELSESASAYLSALPLFTTTLLKYSIPYRGYILVDDAEEHLAGGLYLDRLGLTQSTYSAKCKRNVETVKQAIADDERITQVSAHLFSEKFPDFTRVTADLEKRLYQLSQNDPELRLAMAKVADARLPRHTKILNGKCDFSDSMYLAIHYSAEYMALGYLCRLRSGSLGEDNFIVNYNSPNVEQFNNVDLLANCIEGNVSSGDLISVPIFQVKLY